MKYCDSILLVASPLKMRARKMVNCQPKMAMKDLRSYVQGYSNKNGHLKFDLLDIRKKRMKCTI